MEGMCDSLCSLHVYIMHSEHYEPLMGRCSYSSAPVQGHVVLGSAQYPAQHVGVLPSGDIKEPGRTGTGQHGQFILNLHKNIKVCKLSHSRLQLIL